MFYYRVCAQLEAIHESPLQFGDVIDSEMKMNQFGEIVKECLDEIPNKYPNVEMDEFVVMPNHFHRIIIINEAKTNNDDKAGATLRCPRSDDSSFSVTLLRGSLCAANTCLVHLARGQR